MIAAARVVVCKFSKPLSGLPPAIISSQVAPPLLHQIITSKVAAPHFSLTLLVVGSLKLFFSGLLLLLFGQTHASRLKPRVASADHYRSCLLTISDQPSFISFSIDCISQLLEERETSFPKNTFGFVFQFCCCSTNHGFLFPRLASNLFHFKLILEPTNARTKYHLKPFLFAFTDSHLVNCLDQPFSFQCCCNVSSTNQGSVHC